MDLPSFRKGGGGGGMAIFSQETDLDQLGIWQIKITISLSVRFLMQFVELKCQE